MTVEYYRKVFKWTALDSPNVRYAMAEIAAGKTPSGKVIVPGVLTYEQYLHRRATWDPIKQCVGLDANFWGGADALLYPPEWLDRAERMHEKLIRDRTPRLAHSIGIDTGEGVSDTAMCVVDDYGIIELVWKPTPDTSVILDDSIAFIEKHGVPPSDVIFDRGGGGLQIADMLRRLDYPVRTVLFGERATPPVRKFQMAYQPYKQRVEQKEQANTYKNRRSEMYWQLREKLDPQGDPLDDSKRTFAIPRIPELRNELAPIPLKRNEEDVFYMIPKNKRDDKDTRQTMRDIIGHSPDRADALVLAVYGLVHKLPTPRAGSR